MPFKVEKLRARWEHHNLNKDKTLWHGTYVLPLPQNTNHLPVINDIKNPAKIQLTLEEWQYGQVAYILHVGPYTTEADTIKTLIDFMQQQGFKVKSDSHEESYLSDPNKTANDKLHTIILYRIERLIK